jgi:uncharacterized protein YbjQ (UPF0145 family)
VTPFSSALSVDEFLLVREAGYRPAGLVLGSAVVRLARRRRPRSSRTDVVLTTWSLPLVQAKVSAVARLRDEAALLGAAGVIGVDIAVSRKGLRGSISEVVATGTAVHGPSTERPFTCRLTGQQFWMLLRSGRVPVGLVMGASAYYRTTTPRGLMAYTPALNDENPWRTEGVYRARELALSQMNGAARVLGASSTVGVSVEETSGGWVTSYGAVTEFFMTGTAVRDLASPPRAPYPLRMLPLSG